MKMSSLTFTRRRCKLLFLVPVFLAFSVYGVAGQQTSNTPTTGSVTPSATPVQTTPPSGSGTTSAAQSLPNNPKIDPDQAGVVKLGAGDLVEVNVYNVPELTDRRAHV